MSLEQITTRVDGEYQRVRAEAAVKALRENDFQAYYFPTREGGIEKALELIEPSAVVGCGGSVTIRQLGLLDILTERGNTVIHHWRDDLPREEINRLRKEAMFADVYLSSSNAITLQGQLVNTDGVGNRVAAMIFGPPRVVLLAGYNKIVADEEQARERIKNVASPKNGIRFGSKTSCSQVGRCMDCNSTHRMCKATVILERRPTMTDYHIIIIGEELGY